MPNFRTNADGSAVCPHRDLSVCPGCASDPAVVEVAGAHYYVPDPAERVALDALIADRLDGDDAPPAGWPGYDLDGFAPDDDFDGFDDWAAANGEPATTFVDGDEVVR